MNDSGPLEIVPLEKRNISTMTMVVYTSTFNPEAAFWLLPWKYCVSFTQKKNKKKADDRDEKLFEEEPGTICSIASICPVTKMVRVRGMFREKKAFQHATTVVLSIGKKFVNMKLSSDTIHMCGLSSEKDAITATNLLFEHFVRIQAIVEEITTGDMTNKLKWVKENCQGKPVERLVENVYTDSGPIELTLQNAITDYKISHPRVVPSDRVTKFFLSFCADFEYFSDYLKFLNSICSGKMRKLYEVPPEICCTETIMCNYNYGLNFTVDKAQLKKIFDGNDGFHARHDQELLDYVTIELPYTPRKDTRVKRKRNKVPKHTFIVYRTGSVTQSGPSRELTKEAYNRFMNIIADNIERIRIIE